MIEGCIYNLPNPMARHASSSCLLLLLLLWISPALVSSTCNEHGEKDFYIVYMGNQADNKDEAMKAHINILSSVKQSSQKEAKESMVYSYTKSLSFNAFATKLSPDEADQMMEMEEVVGVFRNRYHKLHTTKSWDFIGLPQSAKRHLNMERDVILGVLDTGITPDSESFKDTGLGPPPSKWRGSCGPFANFSGCNNKLIGAKYFKLDGSDPPEGEILSPIDIDGHGTHTSSTAAGVPVANASLFGLANGTIRGAVPSARVAMYKVCWSTSGCSDMDILAAFDAAIHDGVDVVSISIGGPLADYSTDSISLGSFHALRRGILTVASAGNDGPDLGTVTNHAPWILTVAASGMDRAFRSRIDLGNGKSIIGSGISMFEPKAKLYPLVSGADVAKPPYDNTSSMYCISDSLDAKKVKGKVVMCRLGGTGPESTVKSSGGVGTIIADGHYLDNAQIFMASATMINTSLGDSIDKYIHSTRSPSAVIQRTQEVNVPAPFVASFSSRGPNPASKRLLKPDIAAPGVDILAAFTLKRSLTGLKGDTQFSKYSILSGTSMACPHVAGVAAYVKSFHPNWTIAAIKSAIITSAKPMSRRVNSEAEFGYGGGQLNPRRAANPGLVYDMEEISYVQFLCREGYTSAALAKLVGSRSVNCSSIVPGLSHDSLNYPTMQLALRSTKETTEAVFRRRVTNVGPALSEYKATVRAPKGVEIRVEPMILSFKKAGQKRSFKVVVKAKPMAPGKMVSALLLWQSPRHVVRSPIVIHNPSG
ncbi:PREDICTED: subtilisin-like protease SBT4.14 [Tarenaya hassleriana]|uniref:subtilisin-like protease SBT4.14 n=1 Tax=Tarenaya hassleriana TaxID=28532 RepID=UPI00053C68D6|nr:PREDICTED: subtilisin-like protease SBT4.14 [Tarenaya hassleriana]